MTTELEQARLIAGRIARRVSGSESNPSAAGPRSDVSVELASIRASLGEVQKKLAQLETRVESKPHQLIDNSSHLRPAEVKTERTPPLTHSPWLAGVNATPLHPSQEKFAVEEAVVTELVDFFEKENTCSVEPGGKPCD